MELIIIIAVILITVSFVVAAVSNIITTFKMRKESSDVSSEMASAIYRLSLQDKEGDYLVTKVWYKTGNKSSDIIHANNPTQAYDKLSDERRNLDYYIESVKKL